jgi:hypothetical protein
MGLLSSDGFAQLARKGDVAQSVRLAFWRSHRSPDNLKFRGTPPAAPGAEPVRPGKSTMLIEEPFGGIEESAFAGWITMGLVRPKMGLSGQRAGVAGRSSRPPGQATCGIALENHANCGRAVLGEIVPVLVCLIARLTQQYRCRGGADATFASSPDVGWLIWNALTFWDEFG